MNRRNFLKNLGMGAAALAVGGQAFGSEFFSNKAVSVNVKTKTPVTGKPNIIFIMADDLGYGDIQCYGNPTILTPSLNAMANGGIRLTDYHSNGANCSPTRAALMTGRYQQRCGVEDVLDAASKNEGRGMAQAQVTFAEVFKQNGYVTGLFGKWHLGYQTIFNPTVQGFDEYKGYVSGNVDYQTHIDQEMDDDWWIGTTLQNEVGYSTHLITQHGLDFVERHKNETFCLYLAHEACHYPYQGPNDLPVREHGKPNRTVTAAEERVAYKQMIETMDTGIGQIVNKVRDLGLENNTFIIFCSDNGPVSPGTTGGLKGQKGTTYEGGHRVPAIAYWPGKISAGVSSQTIMTMDWFATTAAAAGIAIPSGLNLDGINVLPVLTEGKTIPSRYLFWRLNDKKAVRKDNWKLVKVSGTMYLYDLSSDVNETTNLASSNTAKRDELNNALIAWEAQF